MDPGSVLGMPALRASFLDDVSTPQKRQAEAGNGTCFVIANTPFVWSARAFELQDDPDYVPDDEDDDDEMDDEDDDDADEDEGDDDDVETWQVGGLTPV